MFFSIPLRNLFAKIISIMSKNRAHQTNLILNYGGFCEIFSQNARNIHAESVSVWEFLGSDVESIKGVGAVDAILALLLKCFVKKPLKFAKEFVKALFLS